MFELCVSCTYLFGIHITIYLIYLSISNLSLNVYVYVDRVYMTFAVTSGGFFDIDLGVKYPIRFVSTPFKTCFCTLIIHFDYFLHISTMTCKTIYIYIIKKKEIWAAIIKTWGQLKRTLLFIDTPCLKESGEK